MASLIYAISVIFVAAIVRGFSGFGFSLLAISALSLAYAPADIVPSIFLMEIAASLNLLIKNWKDVHWRSLLPLVTGCLIATPLGVWALATLPAAPIQLAMAAFVLVAVALMSGGLSLKRMPGLPASIAAGAASGLANGAFGMAGPPACSSILHRQRAMWRVAPLSLPSSSRQT
ncbi:MAG: sulfite exporter TauE/SafE family protein [Hyphomicrobiales bacterium]